MLQITCHLYSRWHDLVMVLIDNDLNLALIFSSGFEKDTKELYMSTPLVCAINTSAPGLFVVRIEIVPS